MLRHDKTRALRARTLDGRALDLRTGRIGEERGPPLDSRWQIVLEPGTSTGLAVSVCGHMGVMQSASTLGKMIGPPAERE